VSADVFEIEMLPAREGDCLWLRYGKAGAPRQMLVDCGRAATYKELKPRLLALPPGERHFELLVITHVDRDHIEGVLGLLEDDALPVTFGDIWFNGFDHLKSAKLETFGAVQGERLTTALLARKDSWNRAWQGRAVAIRGATLPKKTLAGGLTLTVLSPDRQKLLELIPTWEAECRAAGLVPGTKARRQALRRGLEEFGGPNVEALAAGAFSDDSTKPNGSSIALLAEYGGKRIILGADAHVGRLLPSLVKLANGARLAVDAFKIPHHGSEGNVSKELLETVRCPRYLISTSGSYFKHPRAAAMARLLKFGGDRKTLYFNYASKFTKAWDKPALKRKYGYEVVMPAAAQNGTLKVTL
jgi:beta-lactamase superfamily II metal-dependent hydrolase